MLQREILKKKSFLYFLFFLILLKVYIYIYTLEVSRATAVTGIVIELNYIGYIVIPNFYYLTYPSSTIVSLLQNPKNWCVGKALVITFASD